MCGFDPVDELDVVDLLGSLVDKSLVVVDRKQRPVPPVGDTAPVRRDFGSISAARTLALSDRHLGRFVKVAVRAREWYEGTRNEEGWVLFETEWDNLRVAQDAAGRIGDEASADRIVRDSFWYASNTVRDEHEGWVRRRLGASTRRDPEIFGIGPSGRSCSVTSNRQIDSPA